MRTTLRAKGILAFSALVAYVVVVALVLGSERQKLLEIALDLEQIHMQEAHLTKTGFAIDHAQLRLQEILLSAVPTPSRADDVELDAELIQSGMQALQPRHPRLEDDVRRLGVQIEEVRRTASRASLVAMQAINTELESLIEELGVQVRSQHQAKWDEYYRVYDRMSFVAVATMVLAALVFGALVSLFFSRIAWDIGKLEARAAEVIAGYRGTPLAVTRDDEVGGLMRTVNQMQSELRRSERQLELVRQQRFHQEKMAAVGSLAAAVTHEINNPIAAIVGIARSMVSQGNAGQNLDFDGDGLRLILEHAQRISAISRQIAEFSRPHAPRPELTDLNRLVQGVCKFTGYDRRLQSVEMTLDLDPELPAVECIADHLTQVLMNLLINSGDALASLGGRKPEISVRTRRDGGEAMLSVQDNGTGMDAATRDRAFDEGFTTKGEGQGLGLGLFLCKALIEGDSGRIELDSTPLRGTTVTLHLPLLWRGVA